MTFPPLEYSAVSIIMCMAYYFWLSRIDREDRMASWAFLLALYGGALFICLALRLLVFMF